MLTLWKGHEACQSKGQTGNKEMERDKRIKTAAVVCNGEIDDLAWLKGELAGHDAVIAADGGSRHLNAAGVKPDCILGDGDSLPPDYDMSIERIVFPADKDATDTELAVEYAMDHEHSTIVLYGALGARPDHSFCNIMLLAKYCGRLVIKERRAAVYCVPAGDALSLMGKPGDIVSLQPVGAGSCCSTKGLLYALDSEILEPGSRGVSNSLTAPDARISVESGKIIVFHIIDEGKEKK